MKASTLVLSLALVGLLAVGVGCQENTGNASADSNTQLQFFVANGSDKLMSRINEHHFKVNPIDTKSPTGGLVKALLGASTDEFFIVLNPLVNRPLAVMGITEKTEWATVEDALTKIEKINAEGPKQVTRLQPEKPEVVKLLLFSDFQCPHCSKIEDVVNGWQKKYGDKLVVDFANFPLPGHPEARPAAQAAECMRLQNKFEPYSEQLFKNQKTLTPGLMLDLVGRVGGDKSKFKACIASGQTIAKVESDMAFGNFMAIRGTPTLFLNGKLMEGMTQQDLEARLDELVKKGGS